jgi:hypothetical protein
MENQIEAEPTTFPVLSIDAWADGKDGWTWNQWFAQPEKFPAELLDDDAAIVRWFIAEGLLREGTESLVTIDDDQYNKVVCDTATMEPLFAVEYGSSQ